MTTIKSEFVSEGRIDPHFADEAKRRAAAIEFAASEHQATGQWAGGFSSPIDAARATLAHFENTPHLEKSVRRAEESGDIGDSVAALQDIAQEAALRRIAPFAGLGKKQLEAVRTAGLKRRGQRKAFEGFLRAYGALQQRHPTSSQNSCIERARKKVGIARSTAYAYLKLDRSSRKK